MTHRHRPSSSTPVFYVGSRVSSSAALAVGSRNHRRTYNVALIPDAGAGCRNGWTDDDLQCSVVRAHRGHDVAHPLKLVITENSRTRENGAAKRCSFSGHRCYSLFAVITRSKTHDLPAMRAHAASCPPCARERFLSALHGGDHSWSWPHHECIMVLAYTPLISHAASYS